MSRLSESHNFGRFVRVLPDGRIDKPRSRFWEWLFYAENPVRRILDQLDVSRSLPILRFDGDIFSGGAVQNFSPSRVNLISEGDCEKIGEAIAVYAFFGVDDLHFGIE